MVARAEIDMLDIKEQFLKMYGKTLYSFIKVRHEGRETLESAKSQQYISCDIIIIIIIAIIYIDVLP